jgi:hypothetical protein
MADCSVSSYITELKKATLLKKVEGVGESEPCAMSCHGAPSHHPIKYGRSITPFHHLFPPASSPSL